MSALIISYFLTRTTEYSSFFKTRIEQNAWLNHGCVRVKSRDPDSSIALHPEFPLDRLLCFLYFLRLLTFLALLEGAYLTAIQRGITSFFKHKSFIEHNPLALAHWSALSAVVRNPTKLIRVFFS